MLLPTTYLPPIKQISNQSLDALKDALQYLSNIYSPPVRGTRRRKATAETEDPEVQELIDLRTDAFERAYAIKWLTTLVSKLGDDGEDGDEDSGATTDVGQAQVVSAAAALLAACSGTSAAGMLTRSLAFPTADGSLSVALTDAPLDNADYGSVGAQTWGGACVLSEMIAENPTAFGLPRADEPLRILELGAGTGLVSLVLSKLSRTAQIVATDYYPSVLVNLARNVLANQPSPITTAPLDWSIFPATPHDERPAELQAPFDVVFGADIVYEASHAVWIRDCLRTLLRKPVEGERIHPAFHLILPLRATHAAESHTIGEVFPPGADLEIQDTQTLICDTEKPGEEVVYAYYRIGWRV